MNKLLSFTQQQNNNKQECVNYAYFECSYPPPIIEKEIDFTAKKFSISYNTYSVSASDTLRLRNSFGSLSGNDYYELTSFFIFFNYYPVTVTLTLTGGKTRTITINNKSIGNPCYIVFDTTFPQDVSYGSSQALIPYINHLGAVSFLNVYNTEKTSIQSIYQNPLNINNVNTLCLGQPIRFQESLNIEVENKSTSSVTFNYSYIVRQY